MLIVTSEVCSCIYVCSVHCNKCKQLSKRNAMKDVLAINASFMAASPFLANSRMTDQIKDNIFLLTHHEEGLDDDVDDPDDSDSDDDQSSLDCLASDLTVTEGGGIGAGWAKNGLVMKMILS